MAVDEVPGGLIFDYALYPSDFFEQGFKRFALFLLVALPLVGIHFYFGRVFLTVAGDPISQNGGQVALFLRLCVRLHVGFFLTPAISSALRRPGRFGSGSVQGNASAGISSMMVTSLKSVRRSAANS